MAKDYKGARFGKLVMIARVAPGGSGKGAIWACHCDCGNVANKVGKDVAAGRIRSCGNCRKSITNRGPRANRETAILRRKFALAVRRAAREGIKWDLTPSEYSGITSKPCSLCGTAPDRNSATICYMPEIGYTPDTTRCICTDCKSLLGYHNPKKFLEQVVRIYEYSAVPKLSLDK